MGDEQSVAVGVAEIAQQGRVLVLGCGDGRLVQELRARGVDAYGRDTSTAAIASAPQAVRPFLTVASAAEPVEGRYDLVTALDLIERLPSPDAERVVDLVSEATDRVLFTRSADIAGWFAERGFHRRDDVAVATLVQSTMLVERGERAVGDVVRDYETQLLAMRASVEQLEQEALEARHADLVKRDHMMGIEAETGRQNAEIVRLSDALRRSVAQERKLRRSRSGQAKRVVELRASLQTARDRNAALTRRVAELERRVNPPSFVSRVARRLRGNSR